ncbi:hypothetical protein B0T26DRAFT_670945 [Lasiosphaeria miniovina]|uniref:Uncharacterized protein n=1 Tax=Lasiosphaeria miniovina TaxID=1954250 RepID=A0AA40BI63_9PEZI|nr:uncharacterized protein B0T26DRAFT_670945 [Lasiosphaeria miniovina]KAK0734685.1 hypothetical protein B0T26DRAFT_670945 [Lasiosphaeria miniovina]
MAFPLVGSGPGIFMPNSGVLPEFKDVFPYSDFVHWYETVHIPDWLRWKPGAITSAWRYQSVDADRDWPFLVAYKFPNISDLSSPDYITIPLTNPMLPEGGPISKFTHIEAVAGPHIETWRSGSTGDDRGPILVTEEIDPANVTTDKFQEWYRDVYIGEVSAMAGWRRTSRFDNGMGQPRWLALHEFEESSFGPNTTKIAGLLELKRDLSVQV